jgi:glutamate:Na+ symporter, ESS family
MTPDPIALNALEATTLGFLVYLVGGVITRRVRPLREFNIPEPVSGGLLAALVVLGLYLLFDQTVTFDLRIRDYLLVLFFSALGLNARLGDIARGGVLLAILLALTLVLIVLQNALGVATAFWFGAPEKIGLVLGSVSLLGGHGTTIAWAPSVIQTTGFPEALELGIASATLGLVIAALLGGPVAKLLIERNRLTPEPGGETGLGLSYAEEAEARITPVEFTRTMFVLHVVILAGSALHEVIEETGLTLPLFVPCMLLAILAGNILPFFKRFPAVSHRPALALVSDFALGTFLAMSLMAMQLSAMAAVGPMLVVSLVLQTLLVLAFVLAVFRLMGGTYFAAVLSAGFVGYGLGATPTAIANMNAVTKTYGPAPLAFVIVPLISAFFLDLANAAVIQLFLFF